MLGNRITLVPAVWCTLAVIAWAAATDQAASPQTNQTTEKPKAAANTSFIRLVRDKDDNPIALQTAIVRFASPERREQGLTVDLVGAVHIAEKSYYQQLNRQFETYDVVLYELVAPEGTRVPKGGGKSQSLVSMVQKAMQDILELEFQLEQIDYTRKNLVHADMSPRQLSLSMEKRGESIPGLLLRLLGYAIARQSQSGNASDAQLLLALFDKNRALALKRILAEEFEEMGGSLTVLTGSSLIGERNKVALEGLRQQIAAGKKKIAVFYGAGHMPDIEQRLRSQFGLSPVNTRWLVAWNLKEKR